ncbi:hypothetical protein GJR99_11820 [Haloferax sp. MBLA0078]|uniref:Uncharacterized protein n=1 Tax=Haloferax marinum TaxID=2666143 RepID=A0A6A8G932_9EURY|nr:hypothetical protein Hfx1150_11860 [Haloferax sp. CBA1150]MRW97255.1 hypothetical protein [Haloferax marinum]
MDTDRTKRTPNRALLRELASVLSAETWVATVSVFPSNRPDSLVVSLLDEYYPDANISEAYIEVQSYTNGDFHITYIESHHGEQWMCRWDRHDSDDYIRDHFHEPPTAGHDDAVNKEYPGDLLRVVSDVVAPWVYKRMGEVWDEYNA